MKWLRRGLIVLLGVGTLAVAAAAVVLWLLGGERGTAWLTARVLPRAAPMLTVARVRGTLLGGLVLEDVRLRLPRDELDIDTLTLVWDSNAAFAGTLAFKSAAAGRVAYRRVPGPPSTGPVPAAPLPIVIAAGTVDAATFTVGTTTIAIAAARLGARYSGRTLELTDATATYGTAAVAGGATVELDAGVDLDVQASWSGPLAGVAANGNVTLSGAWPELTVHHELGAPFTAVADGTLSFAAAAPRADLALVWQNLAWPGVDAISSPNGNLTLVGTLADYRYEGAGAVVVIGRNGQFAGRGTGQELELAVERLELAAATAEGEAGSLVAQGAVSLAARTAEGDVTAVDFDPRWFVAEWPGRLGGRTHVRAALQPVVTATLDGVDLAGQLRGYPVTLSGAAEVTAPNAWRFAPLTLESGTNRVVAEGMVDVERVDLAIDAAVADLGLLWPGLRGALDGQATLSGTWAEPRARGEIAARDLEFAEFSAQRLDVRGEIGAAPLAQLDLTIEAEDFRRNDIGVGRVRAKFAGTTAVHSVELALDEEQWRVTAEASGGLAGGLWRGTLAALELDERVLGPWRLEEPAALAFGARRALVATSCLVHASGARWCNELDVQGHPQDRLVVSAQNFDLATLRPLLPGVLSVEGIYQLSASLFDLTGEPRGALVLVGERTRARVAYGTEQAFATELDSVQVGATLTQGRLEMLASVRSTAAGAGSADFSARIDDLRARDSPIVGRLQATWPDMSFLALLSPELEEVGGALGVELTVGGTVSEPAIDGQARWTDGSVSVPEWGLVVGDIVATVTGGDRRALEIEVTGRAGDGTLTLVGSTELDAAAGWPTRLRLTGDGVRIVQLSEAEIYATPDLTIVAALPDVTVTGTVHVPRAAIQLSALPAQAVTPSPDAVVHGTVVGSDSQPLRFRTTIELSLGDDVRYAGLNLETKVAGGLRLETAPSASASATGTLTLAGTYNAYGQKLDLERGQLLFTGPIDNPALDVRAVRAIDTTRVGVELAGTLKSPRTRVFSQPAMSEADALSYLLLGRPVSSAGNGAAETATLQTAAISLGLQQALPVVQRIGTSLGLDELSVQTTAADAGALMAGKYLSPKLYIRYSYGLFNRIGGLLLRFKVNERLSIETRSGDQKSMDLLYTVEKD
jgi:translocation and assembly module TamB